MSSSGNVRVIFAVFLWAAFAFVFVLPGGGSSSVRAERTVAGAPALRLRDLAKPRHQQQHVEDEALRGQQNGRNDDGQRNGQNDDGQQNGQQNGQQSGQQSGQNDDGQHQQVSGTHAEQQLCTLRIHYKDAAQDVAVGNESTCALWLVVEHTPTIQPLPGSVQPPRYAIVRAANSLDTATRTYRLGIVSTLIYARLHGYRLFLGTPPALLGRAHNTTQHATRLLVKRHATQALLAYLDAQDAPEHAIMYNDLDGWMNLTKTHAFSIDVLVSSRPQPDQPVSLVLQAEERICSCAFILFRHTPLAATLWDRISDFCAQGYCDGEPGARRVDTYDQKGLYRVILETVNNTNNLRVPAEQCRRNGARRTCLQEVLNLSLERNSNRVWGPIAFINNDNNLNAQNLHTCHWGPAFCDDKRRSIFHHTSHLFWNATSNTNKIAANWIKRATRAVDKSIASAGQQQ